MKTPLIWGHRGASGYAPENTLDSFAKAVELHADGIELDIQLTKDGQIVVCHDEFIDRTSTGKGFLKDYTLEELRQFDFGKVIPGYGHADIPLMSEVFELIRPTDLTINIELKTGVFDYEGIEEKILAMTEKGSLPSELHLLVKWEGFSGAEYVAKRTAQDPPADPKLLYGEFTRLVGTPSTTAPAEG